MSSGSPITAVVAAFALGTAIQRLIDLVEVTCGAVTRRRRPDSAPIRRKAIFGWLATVLALALGWWVPMLAALGHSAPRWFDLLVTALIVSAGADWFNAFAKFVTYSKEQSQEETAAARAERKLTEQVAGNVGARP
jgi:hypothetical protein